MTDFLAGRHALPAMEGDVEGAATELRLLMLMAIPHRLVLGTVQDMYSIDVGVRVDDAIAKHPMFSDARYWFGLVTASIKDKATLDAFRLRDRVLDGFVAAMWFDEPQLTAHQHVRAGEWVRAAALVPFLSPSRRKLYDSLCTEVNSQT